jgi:hypothetical protein
MKRIFSMVTIRKEQTMFAKFDSVKTLKTLIKFAAVALTSPATVSVASSLYPTDLYVVRRNGTQEGIF